MKDVGGAGFAGNSPSFLGRKWAAVNVDVGPERRSPRYHESCHVMILFSRGGDVMWVMFRGSFPGMIISER